MGWWSTAAAPDEIIGEEPVNLLGDALTDSLGETFADDLFTGYLVALAGVLRRNSDELLAQPLESATIVATFRNRMAIRIPVPSTAAASMLAEALHDVLHDIAMHYRDSELARSPTVNEILRTLALAARGRIVGADDGRALDLVAIRAEHGDQPPASASIDEWQGAADRLRWDAMRAVAAGLLPASPDMVQVVAAGLADPDWRVRMTAVLAVGRLRIGSLAARAYAAAVPGTEVGLRDTDRRALLALRDVATQRAGRCSEPRPIHPNPAIAARRAEFLAEVNAAVAGSCVPSPGSPAYVLRALEAPDEVADAPEQPETWRRWLASPSMSRSGTP